MDNDGNFSMFPLSRRNFRTTSHDELTRKYDESRQVPKSCNLTQSISCHHLSNRCLEAGSRILFARFSGVSDRELFKFFDFLWLCVSFFNVHTKPDIISTKWCDL